ncbi:unnamed protein product [Rangifer tarandus platyrhynchus]|uniref:Uncharacterized protein n=1 Tax=Rangifer tarandus platyrhynchus TaxID=3082113 RepID=A0ABN8ZM47_RANTA|nr:unnamed protein product [Rangifer tarandus platyrhynchus]
MRGQKAGGLVMFTSQLNAGELSGETCSEATQESTQGSTKALPLEWPSSQPKDGVGGPEWRWGADRSESGSPRKGEVVTVDRGLPPAETAHPPADQALASRWVGAVSSILGTWLDQYSEDFCQLPDFPCLRQLVAYVQLNMPGSDLERRAHLLLAQLEHADLGEAEPEGEEAHLSTAQRHSVELRLCNRDLQANCLLANEPRRPGGGQGRVFRLGGVATRPAECGASGAPLGGRGCSWWAGRGRVGGASAGGRGAMLLSPPPSSPPGPAHRLRPAPPTALPEASRPAASLISGPSCAPPSVLTSGRPQGAVMARGGALPKVGAELVRSEPRSQESSASRRNARLPPLAPTASQGDRRRPSLPSNPLPQAACDPAVPAPGWISCDPAVSPRILLQVLWP